MTWIVRVALERPLTFIVLALLIMIFGPMAAFNMPTDIFPAINIPGGRRGVQLWRPAARKCRAASSRHLSALMTTAVDNIEHIESQSLPGVGIVKIFFQPTADIRLATSQIAAVAPDDHAPACRPAPSRPSIINYSAATVPVLQVAYSSKVLSESEVLDLAQNFVRPHLVSVRGRWRCRCRLAARGAQICFDLDPQAMQAHGLSASDVQNASDQPEPDRARPATPRSAASSIPSS